MVLLAFRHGLRASELVDLRWEQVDLENGILHVRKVKQGTPATHPLTGRELRALRRLQREASSLPFLFVSERGAPFSKRGFQAMVERAAQAAGFDMKIHPHMLRHAAATSWRMTASILARSKAISATDRSSTPCVIRSWRQRVSKVYLEISVADCAEKCSALQSFSREHLCSGISRLRVSDAVAEAVLAHTGA